MWKINSSQTFLSAAVTVYSWRHIVEGACAVESDKPGSNPTSTFTRDSAVPGGPLTTGPFGYPFVGVGEAVFVELRT